VWPFPSGHTQTRSRATFSQPEFPHHPTDQTSQLRAPAVITMYADIRNRGGTGICFRWG